MAHGGGTWRTQNKALPGTYINFTSLAKATVALSERGTAAAPFELSWGPEGSVFLVEAADFYKNSRALFGYGYDAPEMLFLREIFLHATKVYCYRLGDGGVKASNAYGTAKYPGTRGNAIVLTIAQSVDDEDCYDVETLVDGVLCDSQTVSGAASLVDNDFVAFKKDAVLKEEAGVPMTGGTNCSSVTGAHHQAFLDRIESYSFNTLCCPAADDAIVTLYSKFTERVRDELGSKFQLVAYQPGADYEGVIGVWNESSHAYLAQTVKHSLVYWVAGAQAAAEINESLTNAAYDGELTVDVGLTQSELEAGIKTGKLLFHDVNGTVRVLEDINTLVTLTDEKNELFQSNQTMRVCDQIANDIAVLFSERYVGKVPNDASGRAALWNDAVKLIQELERIRAVENFDSSQVSIEIGDSKKSVLMNISGLSIVNAMSQLYMSVVIQ